MQLMTRTCQECGRAFESRHTSARFCPGPARCRAQFNDRRQARGAELYDFMMAKHVEDADVDALVNELLAAYAQADNIRRGGRRSFQRLREAKQGVQFAYGSEGDGR